MLKYKYECDKCTVVATQLGPGVPTDWLDLGLTARINNRTFTVPAKLLCPECTLKMGINPADAKPPESNGDQLYDLIYEIGVEAVENSTP